MFYPGFWSVSGAQKDAILEGKNLRVQRPSAMVAEQYTFNSVVCSCPSIGRRLNTFQDNRKPSAGFSNPREILPT